MLLTSRRPELTYKLTVFNPVEATAEDVSAGRPQWRQGWRNTIHYRGIYLADRDNTIDSSTGIPNTETGDIDLLDGHPEVGYRHGRKYRYQANVISPGPQNSPVSSAPTLCPFRAPLGHAMEPGLCGPSTPETRPMVLPQITCRNKLTFAILVALRNRAECRTCGGSR
jgi:hypothetical protein